MKTRLSKTTKWGLIILGLMGMFPTVWSQSSTNIGLPKSEDVPNLIAVLQQSDASQFDKARACQQLAIIGGKDAVAALAALLADEHLSNYGRCGLEEIPDPAAETALREAMGKLQGQFLIGVVNSIGVRRDPKAVEGLIKLVSNPAKGAAPEALLALSRIATPEAVEFLQQTLASGPADLRSAAAEGCIRIAERQLTQDQPDSAMKLYDAVGRADVPKPLRMAALRGSILSRQSAGLPLLLESLNSDDPVVLEIALRTARELPGSEVTLALANRLPTVKPSVQVLLLKVLMDRNDPSVCPAIEALAASESGEVRTVTMQALGKIGGPSSVPILLKSIADSKTVAESDAAVESLTRLSAKETDTEILKAVPSARPGVRAQLIAILGYRGAAIATQELLKQAADDNPAVSKAAFVALASVAGINDLPEVVRLTLACKDDSSREKAERTTATIAAKNPDKAHRNDLLIANFQEARDSKARCSLLRILAMIGDPAGCNQIMSAYKDPDPQVSQTAFRLLIDWPDATPAPLLLEIFKTSTDKVSRTLALRGVVRMASLESDHRDLENQEAIRWLTEANREIRDLVDEKRLILSGLGSLKCLAGLQLLSPYLDDPAVQQEAAIAVIRISKALTSPKDRLMAKSSLEMILKKSKDPGVLNQAKQMIEQIPGKSIDLEINGGTDPATLSFRPLFDGKTFKGWQGDTAKSFRIEGGAIVGGNLKEPIPRNEFLVTTRTFTNFILMAECRLAGPANGGIQFRSARIPNNNEVAGYQADMDQGGEMWGSLWDESRRGLLIPRMDPARIRQIVKPNDWNLYEIRCEGRRIRLFLNGELTADYTETDANIPASGIIAVQIHGGGPSECWYRNLRIAELPE